MQLSFVPTTARRAFTMADALIAILVLAIVIALLVLFVQSRPTRAGPRHDRDANQVRGLTQAIAIWANSNQNRFPQPSQLDKDNNTLTIEAVRKDTTANVLSILIANNHITTELCISPRETNEKIRQIPRYTFTDPPSAANPAKALWDPAFSADFTAPGGGNTSYATMAMTPDRLNHYGQSDATFAILGNRGPEVTVTKRSAPEVGVTLKNPQSNTLLIHGGPNTWEGYIAYADTHANFESRVDPEALEYKDATKTRWRDVLFIDEPDDPSGLNAYLGIFVNNESGIEAIYD